MKDFEKLGAFYLGRPTGREEPLLYDSKDLTTHGLIVGMTGSGKTGLSVVLLEEAAMDGVPALILDPKGDMTNLALRFPRLRAEDFRPWIDPAEATRRGTNPDALAAETATMWARGLEDSGQSKRRIEKLEEASEVVIYTPGSAAGRPMALLRSFDPPPPALLEDMDALRDRVSNTVSGLLSLIGLEADPVTSREHILLSNLLEGRWREGEGVTLEGLLVAIQNPPFDKLGVLDLESFFPAKERFALATRLNNLLASPAFAAWREGDPLDVQRLLYSPGGKPRLSVLSIAHLSDEERMFFVTLCLNEVIAWMRNQKGTGSLRAVLYMDEIFGFFPPVKEPPSKAPMLTLLKQARAFGLGVLLATQNPVDLDYKGLANIGTWFLGRLQTARDRDRLLEGLTASAIDTGFDRARLAEIVGSLGKRTFLARNIHENAPVVFKTRWAMSYLRGPLTLAQVKALTGTVKTSEEPVPLEPRPAPEKREEVRPVLPAGIAECFLSLSDAPDVYQPCLLASVDLHYVKSSFGLDVFQRVHLLTPLAGLVDNPDWASGRELSETAVDEEPAEGIGFEELPSPAANEKNYPRWQKSFLSHLYRARPLKLYRCRELDLVSEPGESEGDFRSRMLHAARERRDEALEKLRQRFAPKLARLQERVRKAEARLARESSQYDASKMDTAISFGSTLLGALFGRKLASRANVGRARSAARSASRASREREDVVRAEAELAAQKRELLELETELEQETRALQDEAALGSYQTEQVDVRSRKSDATVQRFALAWTVL